jgi:general secretion pathway protein E
VHANSVIDVIGRFIHMGLDPYSLVSALNGIAAQRLLRLLCTHCALAQPATLELLGASGVDAAWAAGGRLLAPRGCAQCRGTGYRGRRAIAEVLRMDDELRELIAGREPVRRVKDLARQRGMRSLRQAALALAHEGVTSLQEVNRVTLVERAGAGAH